MPAIIALLMRGLLWAAGSIAGQVLVSLGIGVITYTGIDMSLDYAKSQALGAMQGMGADIVNLMAYMKIGVCINIITSAIVMRMTGQGLKNGAMKAFRKK
ncbi:DUF2523 domain-containing protein [Xenophilus azovorans]|uniref:DUF2523 domain-containing protein n=1 Tax=Xenophilus azovorans TaxID=151755 RepID=UPI00056FED19|nr:DUF2523 domain-containing protein [Xenophilus azovorans]